MIAKTLCVLLAVGLASANPFAGADPNTLKCDPAGLVFLLLPHYSDCGKFYMCVHGKEVEMNCPTTTIFDFDLQGCNHEWATTCQLRDNGDVVEGSGDDGDGGSGSGSGGGSGGRAMRQWHTQLEQVDEIQKQAVTASLMDCNRSESASRQMPYSGDCQRYWRCNGRNIEAVYCSDGLFFNPQTRQCDFEANVKCLVESDELAGEFIVYK